MSTKLWFHIDERIGLQLDLPRKAALVQRIYGSTYEYYQIPRLTRDAELRLAIGQFQPRTPPGSKTVNKEFIVAPDYICWKGNHGRGTTEFIGLESAKTQIRHVPYREFGPRMLIPGFRAIGMYVEPLLKYHLAIRHQVHLLHGGAVARDGQAIAFFGPNGVHKTRLILELCREHGFSFLGDDLILLEGPNVLPFIEHERILKARYAMLNRPNNKIYSKLTLARTLLNTKPPTSAGLRIGPASRLALAVFLDRQAGPEASSSDLMHRRERGGGGQAISFANLWQRINALERAELIKHQARHRQVINFGRLLMAYEFGAPGSHIFRYMLMDDRPAPEGLQDVACRHLLLPEKFRREVTSDIKRLIDTSVAPEAMV